MNNYQLLKLHGKYELETFLATRKGGWTTWFVRVKLKQ